MAPGLAVQCGWNSRGVSGGEEAGSTKGEKGKVGGARW